MSNPIGDASDSDLAQLANQVHAAMASAPATYGVLPADVAAFQALAAAFKTDILNHVAARANAKAMTQRKNATRAEVEKALRKFRKSATASNASEAAIAALGIPKRSSMAPANATQPVGRVDTGTRLQHTIHWTDEADPENRRKPRGVLGAEIWVKIGGPQPGDEKDCVFLTVDASTPYVAAYDGADAGKMAHYMLRWRMRDGSVSGWGETVSATITG